MKGYQVQAASRGHGMLQGFICLTSPEGWEGAGFI